MAVGGHLSSFLDWGVDLSSGSISGAPWHFRVTVLKQQGNGSNFSVVADGNHDRSINIFKTSALRIGKLCTSSSGSYDPATSFDFELDVDGNDVPFSLACGKEFSTRIVHGSNQTYTIEELAGPIGWDLKGAVCTDQNGNFIDSGPVNDPDSDAIVGFSFTPQPHDRITCTFTNNFNPQPTPPPPGSNGRRFITGGGSVLDGGGTIVSANANRVTHGFHLLCGNLHGNKPSKASNNLEVNWIDSKTLVENHFHLDGASIDYSQVICDNDGGDPRNPKTLNNWNRYTYNNASGTLNGAPATASWIIRDDGEPGRKTDNFTITITNSLGNVVMKVVAGGNAQPGNGNIDSGNHQAH
jgi:hypothetical protein